MVDALDSFAARTNATNVTLIDPSVSMIVLTVKEGLNKGILVRGTGVTEITSNNLEHISHHNDLSDVSAAITLSDEVVQIAEQAHGNDS